MGYYNLYNAMKSNFNQMSTDVKKKSKIKYIRK